MLPPTSVGRTPDSGPGCDCGSGAGVQAGIAASAAIQKNRAVRLIVRPVRKTRDADVVAPNLRHARGRHNAAPVFRNFG